MIRLAASAGKAPIVWQEAFDQGIPLPPGTRVQVWKWWRDALQVAREEREASAQPHAAAVAGQAGVLGGWGEGAGEGLAAARRLAAESPGAAAAAQWQRQQAATEEERARVSCDPGLGCPGSSPEQEAWKAELQVGRA